MIYSKKLRKNINTIIIIVKIIITIVLFLTLWTSNNFICSLDNFQISKNIICVYSSLMFGFTNSLCLFLSFKMWYFFHHKYAFV